MKNISSGIEHFHNKVNLFMSEFIGLFLVPETNTQSGFLLLSAALTHNQAAWSHISEVELSQTSNITSSGHLNETGIERLG